jgi:methyl-accepting chemotaxis protein
MTIGLRITTGFTLLTAIAMAIGITAYLAIVEIGVVRLPSVEGLMYIREAQTAIDGAENALLCAALTPDMVKKQYARFDEAAERIKKGWAMYEPLPQTVEEKKLWDEFVPVWKAWLDDHDAFAALAKSYWNSTERTDAQYQQLTHLALVTNSATFGKTETILNKLVDRNVEYGKDEVVRMKWIIPTYIAIGALLSIILGLFIVVGVNRTLRAAVGVLGRTTTALGGRATSLAREARESSTRLTGVAASAEELSTSASTMATSAEEMTVGSTTVAASAEQLSGSATAVATAVEEMTASIQEISKGATSAATVATRAKELAGSATTVMHTLGEAAVAIGKVTETITDIAAQTNLLALNATIEAARAGAAGRGFAVVAGEVKQLAQQASTAAGDIAQRIATIQGKTSEATKALADITAIIEQLNQSSGQTAAAVQEQTATVSEIGRNISETSTAAKGIAQAISEVKTGIDEISRNTTQSATASRDVAGALATLSQTMESASTTSTEVAKAMQELAVIATRLQRLAGGRMAAG